MPMALAAQPIPALAFPAAAGFQLAGLIGSTFISEDLTCVAAGLLVRQGQLTCPIAIAGCTLGIFLGDLGLWLLGRVVGRRVVAWNWVRRRLPESQIERFGHWFDRRGWAAVLAARFVPGLRFPVYLAAGIVGRRAGRFVWWALLAALLWTPLLVILVTALGPVLVGPLERLFGSGWIALVVGVALLFVAFRALQAAASEMGRARLVSLAARLWQWEFWPTWLFYLPLFPWLAYLAIRHRGITTPTAANPGIPHGGVVGESKFDILSRLPSEWVVPTTFLKSDPPDCRAAALAEWMSHRGISFPIILKPDAGQRGVGLRLVRDAGGARRYLEQHSAPLLAQAYHPGPFEAGIFYIRMPDQDCGRIFSITDKHFPVLIGDGASTIEALIWRHPRYRMQASVFLARLNGQAESVLSPGERLPLAVAGNHCQGTLFRDGSHLITPALEDRIDRISRAFDGFYFGRYDVRYSDPEALKAGREFAIVELNGATSESTNIYDPSWSILAAYRVLMRQWDALFQIAALNRLRGARTSSVQELIAEARRYYRTRGDALDAD
ncbi:MAG: VTT domain-containing protein [Phycisphaerae bacterium]